MELLRTTRKPPIGLAFEIADLMLLQSWVEFHDVRMVVELDHWVEGEEYEEVVAFYAKDSSLRNGILWRSATDIVAQPLIGRTCRFGSVADARDSLLGVRSDCQEYRPVSKMVRRPRRSKGQSATPRRAKQSGAVGDGDTLPSVR
jgi:hypothetical protein